ncbi:MAG: endonuclease MutS2, partial [Clostridia bacterium]|nr:endonuclease MutS2 [Clostridia bacterium]
MFVNAHTIKTLEFDKIIQRLEELCFTRGAVSLARKLLPTDDYEQVLSRQKKTADARRLASHKGYPLFGNVADICSSVEKTEKGGTLSIPELTEIAGVLRSARVLRDYNESNRLFSTSLDDVFSSLIAVRHLEDRIQKSVLTEDTLADEASPALGDIRRKMRSANNRIKEILQAYTGGPRSKYLQENIVTVRDGRYVVPVKSEYRNEIKGLLHDTSASGATLFIEPMGVVEANNELRELKAKEKQETDRILAEL